MGVGRARPDTTFGNDKGLKMGPRNADREGTQPTVLRREDAMSDELNAAAPEAVTPNVPATPAPMEPAPSMNVLVASKVKAVVKSKGLRSDGKLADALNAKVITLIEQAAQRAKAEGRATVRPHDLAA
jgi:hypothetical protein